MFETEVHIFWVWRSVMGCTQSTPNGVSSPGRDSDNNGERPDGFQRTKSTPLSDVELQQRIESSGQAQQITIGGVSMSYAFLSQRGYYPDCKWNASNLI